MILYRSISKEDKKQIKIFDSSYISDYIDDKFTFKKAIVKEEEEIVVIGLGRVINEFKIAVNPKFSNFQIAKAINALFEEAKDWIGQHGSNETIIIITKGGEKYQNFLSKHFGFEKIDGTPMRLES